MDTRVRRSPCVFDAPRTGTHALPIQRNLLYPMALPPAAADVERALQALAIAGGSPKGASELLKEGGVSLTPTQLAQWKRRHAQRYTQICQDLAPEIQNMMAADAESLALRYAEVETTMVDRLASSLDEDPDAIRTRDLPQALKALSTARAISTDKSQLLRGKPTQINVNASLDELLAKLSSLADEADPPPIVDAQLVTPDG